MEKNRGPWVCETYRTAFDCDCSCKSQMKYTSETLTIDSPIGKDHLYGKYRKLPTVQSINQGKGPIDLDLGRIRINFTYLLGLQLLPTSAPPPPPRSVLEHSHDYIHNLNQEDLTCLNIHTLTIAIAFKIGLMSYCRVYDGLREKGENMENLQIIVIKSSLPAIIG